MVSIEDYQCEHLFLLIGSNPLPNYVAAKLLTQPAASMKPKLYLIHSGEKERRDNTGTANYADYLYQVLGDGFDGHPLKAGHFGVGSVL